MIQLNYCDNIQKAQELFVDVLNEQGPFMLFGNPIMPARLLYCTMPDVFAKKFHDFVAELVAQNLAEPKAIYWNFWQTLTEHTPTLPDYNVIMRGAELQSRHRAHYAYTH